MNKIQIIKKENKNYPQKLKHIYSPPKVLYVLGDINILNFPSIAIVGGRDYTEYGKKSAYYFSYNLAKSGFVIVSGLAKGIDSFSHIGCLSARGKTIAIIGSGLDNIYPKVNKELAKKIIQTGGCIISEYPLGTKPKRSNFPERNRIISGISNSVLVIEAKEKSGSLITANFALEQGRDVFAVPGNINSKNSIGTNLLIQEGAIPALNYKDILKNI